MSDKPGIFVISLDLELYWGVRDKRSIEQYRENLDGVRNAVEQILELFKRYEIHATWATVGFLHFKNKAELQANQPEILPEYEDEALSPYRYMETAGDIDDAYHFAPDLIEMIRDTPGQEIGTHSFSHYYCLEKGQTAEAFRADIQAAIDTAAARGLETRSLVFARNQVNPEYIPILHELGIKAYRGCEQSWLHAARERKSESGMRRALRLADAYINLSGNHTAEFAYCNTEKPANFPSSRFLRPYNAKLSFFDGLRMRRIKNAMSEAARKEKIFHLWWHPHNFGKDTASNLQFLKGVLEHFHALNHKEEFQSLNMGEAAA